MYDDQRLPDDQRPYLTVQRLQCNGIVFTISYLSTVVSPGFWFRVDETMGQLLAELQILPHKQMNEDTLT